MTDQAQPTTVVYKTGSGKLMASIVCPKSR